MEIVVGSGRYDMNTSINMFVEKLYAQERYTLSDKECLPLIQVVTPWISEQKLTDFDAVLLQDEFMSVENGMSSSQYSFSALLSNLILSQD